MTLPISPHLLAPPKTAFQHDRESQSVRIQSPGFPRLTPAAGPGAATPVSPLVGKASARRADPQSRVVGQAEYLDKQVRFMWGTAPPREVETAADACRRALSTLQQEREAPESSLGDAAQALKAYQRAIHECALRHDSPPMIGLTASSQSGVKGAAITSVAEDGLARRLGMQAGDVIKTLNGIEVRSASELHQLMQLCPGNYSFVVQRGEQQIAIQATPDELVAHAATRQLGLAPAPPPLAHLAAEDSRPPGEMPVDVDSTRPGPAASDKDRFAHLRRSTFDQTCEAASALASSVDDKEAVPMPSAADKERVSTDIARLDKQLRDSDFVGDDVVKLKTAAQAAVTRAQDFLEKDDLQGANRSLQEARKLTEQLSSAKRAVWIAAPAEMHHSSRVPLLVNFKLKWTRGINADQRPQVELFYKRDFAEVLRGHGYTDVQEADTPAPVVDKRSDQVRCVRRFSGKDEDGRGFDFAVISDVSSDGSASTPKIAGVERRDRDRGARN